MPIFATPTRRFTLTPVLFIALLLCPALLVESCHPFQQKKVREALSRAEQQIWSHPDSALATLQAVQDVEKYGETEAHYALLFTQALYRNGLPLENDSLIRLAVNYYDQADDSLRKAWSNYYLAIYYGDNDQKEEAVNYYLKAETAGLQTKDNQFLGHLYDNWGYALRAVKPYENALRLTMKAMTYYEAIRDSAGLTSNYYHIGSCYQMLGNEERSKTYMNKAIDIALASHNTHFLPILYAEMAFNNEVFKHYDKALQDINIALRYSLAYDTTNLTYIYTTKGYIFKGLQQYDSAKYYLAKMDTSDFTGKAIYHMEVSEINKGMGNYSDALLHQELYANYLDSFYNHNTDDKLAELQKKYSYSQMQYENERLKGQARSGNTLALAIFLIAVIGVFYSYYLHTTHEKKRNQIIQLKNDIINENKIKLQQITNELLMQQQALQEKEQNLRLVIERGKKLEEKLKESASGSTNKQQEQLERLISEQKELKERIFLANEVVKKIENLKSLNPYQKRNKKQDIQLSPEERSQLYEAVNYSFNNMENRLREMYPALSEDDIFICCLLRTGVSNGDICLLTESSDAALKKRKYRIKHDKMKNTEEGISLDDILKKI